MPSSSQAHQRVKELAQCLECRRILTEYPKVWFEQNTSRKARELDSIRNWTFFYMNSHFFPQTSNDGMGDYPG